MLLKINYRIVWTVTKISEKFSFMKYSLIHQLYKKAEKDTYVYINYIIDYMVSVENTHENRICEHCK